MGSSQRATWCSFIKKYHIKGIISDKQLLEIKKVAFSIWKQHLGVHILKKEKG